MSVTIADTDAALHALLPDWHDLWHRAGSPPFQSTAWLLSWWEAFGTGQPRVAALRAGGMLAGLLPLYLLDEAPERKLLPLGIGITDYCDALIAPDAPPGTATLLLHAALLRAVADGVTSCTLAELQPGAALLDAALPPGWDEAALPGTPCPVLDVAAAIPAGQLRNLRQSRHRADRCGGWSAELGSDPAGLWQTLLGMHQARWTALGHPGGVLADPAVQAFHAAALPRLAAGSIVRMQVLRVGGRIAALYHTLAQPGRLLFYLSGFDAAAAFVSPGTLLLGHLIEQARAEGVAELHFLRGGEAYKYAWGAVDRMNTTRLLRPAPR